jgi:hypothetical protein
MHSYRLLTIGPGNEPLWVRLYIQPVGEQWAAMLLGDTVPPPVSGEVKGLGFFGASADEVEHFAKVYLGMANPRTVGASLRARRVQ